MSEKLRTNIESSGDDSVLLQQHAHHLLLTRHDMKEVDKFIRAKSPCTTADIIAFMDQVYYSREL